MGVPISFLDKYCPEQFVIVNPDDYSRNPVGGLLAPGADGWHIEGKKRYARIFIKAKESQ